MSGVVDSTSNVRDDITFGSFGPSMETETTTSGSYPPFDTDCARDDITFGSFGPSRTASAIGVTDTTTSDTDMTSCDAGDESTESDTDMTGCDAGDESAGEVSPGGVYGAGQILSLLVVVVSVSVLLSALRAVFAVAGELAQPVIANSTRGAAMAVGIFRDGVTSICRYIGGAALRGIGSASASVWTSMALTAVTENTIGSTSRSSVAAAAVVEVSQRWEEEVETPLVRSFFNVDVQVKHKLEVIYRNPYLYRFSAMTTYFSLPAYFFSCFFASFDGTDRRGHGRCVHGPSPEHFSQV